MGKSISERRTINDYYITPVSEIILFLNEAVKHIPDLLQAERILDPCAGGDSNHPPSYPEALKALGVPADRITTLDIREDSPAQIHADYLQTPMPGFDLIITNPPYLLAQEVIEKALSEVNDNGYVVMLVRLNFFGSQKRREFWHNNMPKYVFVHPKRISFTGDGRTDATEYCHMIWQKGYNGGFAMLKVL